jgi:predicted TIM-barrel fold metal-dependent hydrolase
MRSGDHLTRPWLDRLKADLEPLELYDAHTHIGREDPDTFTQEAPELLERLEVAGARGVVFPMHTPSGYPAANDEVLEAAAASEGRLVAFARVDPRADAIAEAERCLDRGARGIKLHPRAERFDLGEPAVHGLFALAEERRVPILIHAGRGIPALGQRTLELNAEHPGAPVILAHAAISDLAWMWRHADEHPTLFVDTSWWLAADLLALFAYFPPGQILFASDAPYASVTPSAAIALRCALQAGLSPEAVRSVAGGQLARLLDGQEALDLGPAAGPTGRALDPLLERVATHLTIAVGRELGAPGGAEEGVALARLAADVHRESPLAPLCAQVLALLDAHDGHRVREDKLQFSHLWILALAITLARTPDVPLADL